MTNEFDPLLIKFAEHIPTQRIHTFLDKSGWYNQGQTRLGARANVYMQPRRTSGGTPIIGCKIDYSTGLPERCGDEELAVLWDELDHLDPHTKLTYLSRVAEYCEKPLRDVVASLLTFWQLEAAELHPVWWNGYEIYKSIIDRFLPDALKHVDMPSLIGSLVHDGWLQLGDQPGWHFHRFEWQIDYDQAMGSIDVPKCASEYRHLTELTAAIGAAAFVIDTTPATILARCVPPGIFQAAVEPRTECDLCLIKPETQDE